MLNKSDTTINRGLKFSAIQIIALLLSIFILAITLAGSHGRLSFGNVGGAVAAIITIILAIPLLYLLSQRQKPQYKKLLFFIATLLFSLAMTVIYIGLPYVTKQFIIDKKTINSISVYSDDGLTMNFDLQPDMFERVYIEAKIRKANNIEFKSLNLTILNSKNEVLKPVFNPLAWDSLHSESVEMGSFFEINDYSKMNKFTLSAQYSIEHTDSLKIEVDFTFTKNGKPISNNKQFEVRIANHLMLEKLIEY